MDVWRWWGRGVGREEGGEVYGEEEGEEESDPEGREGWWWCLKEGRVEVGRV